MSTPDGLPPLREVIGALGLSAKKSLGQNFLLDFNLTRRIARAAGPLEGVTVVEVGPGPGGLTRSLLLEGAAKIVVIERDARCLPALEAIPLEDARAWIGRIREHPAGSFAMKMFDHRPVPRGRLQRATRVARTWG